MAIPGWQDRLAEYDIEGLPGRTLRRWCAHPGCLAERRRAEQRLQSRFTQAGV